MTNTKNNKSKATKNVVEIIGKVKENKIKVDKDKVNGSLVVQYGDKPQDQTEIRVFVSRKRQDGTENKGYDIAKDFEKLVSTAQATEDNPVDVVRIYNNKENFAPHLSLNEYKNENTNMVISNIQVDLGFGKIYKGDFTKDRFKGEFDMIVYLHKNPKMEIENEEETGRLIVEALMLNYHGAVKPLTFIVEDEELVDTISDCKKGDTVNFWGSCQVAQITESKTKKSGFGGKAKVDTKTYTQRQLLVEGGDPIDEDDELAIDKDFIKKGLIEREQFLEELKNKDISTSKKSKGGFGGKGKSSPINDEDIPF